jgi:glycosyltransferase involved in cell wall biosynthesis
MTHVGDLDVTQGAIGRALADTDAELRIIGTGKGVSEALDAPVAEATGWVELEDYPWELGKLDVGLVPLKLNRFNKAKSWLKGLEMASLGVPFVASGTEQYMQLRKRGIGRIAESPEEWQTKVTRLIEDAPLREELGEQAREAAESLTIESHCEEWLEAWDCAIAHATQRKISVMESAGAYVAS